MTKKGAAWRPVQAKSLSDRSRKLYRQYVLKLQEASALGHQLKDAVTSEWNDKYPGGINGQVCAFNAINGVLQYVMKPKKKNRTPSKRSFDEDSGDDVFSSHPAKSQQTNEREDVPSARPPSEQQGMSKPANEPEQPKAEPKWRKAIRERTKAVEEKI